MKIIRLRLFPTVALLFFLLAGSGRYLIGEEEESAIPVHFIQNKDLSLNLYPAGFQSAAVFTAGGIDGNTEVEPLTRLAALLGNTGVMGTLFVYPDNIFQKNIALAHPRIKLLKKLSILGFEFSQSGQPAPAISNGENAPEAQKTETIPLAEYIGEIKAGRKILAMLGSPPSGYLDYNSAAPGRILSVLDKLGYLYYCAGYSPPNSNRNFQISPNWDHRSGGLYPEPAAGLQILKFYPRIDPTRYPEEARKFFQKISRKSGVFIYYTHLPEVGEEESLDKLRQFIEYLKKQNTWLCSLEELSGWWDARRKVKIETRRDGDTLVINYENSTRFPLKNARLNFKDGDTSWLYYRVEDQRGVMTSQGGIPSSGFINATLFPDESVDDFEHNIPIK